MNWYKHLLIVLIAMNSVFADTPPCLHLQYRGNKYSINYYGYSCEHGWGEPLHKNKKMIHYASSPLLENLSAMNMPRLSRFERFQISARMISNLKKRTWALWFAREPADRESQNYSLDWFVIVLQPAIYGDALSLFVDRHIDRFFKSGIIMHPKDDGALKKEYKERGLPFPDDPLKLLKEFGLRFTDKKISTEDMVLMSTLFYEFEKDLVQEKGRRINQSFFEPSKQSNKQVNEVEIIEIK